MTSGDEQIQVSKTMAFLLRHRPDVGGLAPDPEGGVAVIDLATALSKQLRREVSEAEVRAVAEDGSGRFLCAGDRIRANREPPAARRKTSQDDAARRDLPPDILYHATTEEHVRRVLQAGVLTVPEGRQLFLSSDEAQAWRVAHRLQGGPRVLYVDASRARRHGARFWRSRRTGLFQTRGVPLQDVLNLQVGFAEQISAGGIPVRRGPDGVRLALIKVARKSGVTWEVAKGKLADGEPPEFAAVREVQEEMGISVDLKITHTLGIVRYGFLAPGGLPRLKTVHVYLLEPQGEIASFLPAAAEGIGDVGWFTPEEAARAVTHTSLVPLIQQIGTVL